MKKEDQGFEICNKGRGFRVRIRKRMRSSPQEVEYTGVGEDGGAKDGVVAARRCNGGRRARRSGEAVEGTVRLRGCGGGAAGGVACGGGAAAEQCKCDGTARSGAASSMAETANARGGG